MNLLRILSKIPKWVESFGIVCLAICIISMIGGDSWKFSLTFALLGIISTIVGNNLRQYSALDTIMDPFNKIMNMKR
jgi:uncharacterized membrane protein YjjP (DUF1212 family)